MPNLSPQPLSDHLDRALRAKIDPSEPGAEQRTRVLIAAIHVIAERGYARATVSDVVRVAGVSRSTFYEHFAGKDACALSVYSALGRVLLDASRTAAVSHAEEGWPVAVRAGVDTFFLLLKTEPEVARFFFVEMDAVGPEWVRARAAIHRQLAQICREILDEIAQLDPGAPTISGIDLELTVGGVDTLIANTLTTGSLDDLDAVAEAAFNALGRTGNMPADG